MRRFCPTPWFESAMRILLLKGIKELGLRGDLVTVSNGYARNYLIPRKIAVPATEGVMEYAGRLKATEDKRLAEQRRQQEEMIAKLASVSCTLVRKAGEDEKIFGSVSGADIAEALKSQGFDIDRHSVILENPIKALGVYTVPIQISSEFKTSVKVWVVKETEKA